DKSRFIQSRLAANRYRLLKSRQDVTAAAAKIDQLRVSLAEAINEARNRQLVLRATLEQEEVGPESYAQLYDSLMKMTGIESVKATLTSIVVVTDLLISPTELFGERRIMGKFEVEINLNNHTIGVKNLTHKIYESNHPHDMGSGTMCWGDDL